MAGRELKSSKVKYFVPENVISSNSSSTSSNLLKIGTRKNPYTSKVRHQENCGKSLGKSVGSSEPNSTPSAKWQKNSGLPVCQPVETEMPKH